jgi:hypothetical protein
MPSTQNTFGKTAAFVGLLASLLLFVPLRLSASPPTSNDTPDKFSVPSPDGKFIFRQTVQWNSDDGEAAFTVIDARTKRPVLIDPAASLPPMEDSITCLWAPDSKRFAINARVAGRRDTTELFEWTGKDFHHIPSIENAITALLSADRKAQLTNAHIPTDTAFRQIWDTYKTLEWQDPDTVKALASSTRSYTPDKGSPSTRNLTSALSLTLKLQKDAPPKIVSQSALLKKTDAD